MTEDILKGRVNMSIAYDKDFYGWVNEQAELLRTGALNQLDIENLIEEVESMGRSELSALRNRLKILIAHLLKWKYQPTYQGRSWALTIKGQRNDLKDLLDDSPSLKYKMRQNVFIKRAWKSAVIDVAKETGFDEKIFPIEPIWTLDEILSEDFLPQ
jgi:hypothetical protein